MPILSNSPEPQPPDAGRNAKNWKFWAGLASLATLFLLMRWNNFNAPLIRDEGEYSYCAQILKGGGVPYQEAFIQKPPMVIYSYWLANFLLPEFWAPRVLAGVFVAVATVLLGFIARREFGRGLALPAMLLLTPMVFLPRLEQFTANTEMFLLLPMLGVFAIYSHARPNGCKFKYWFVAGVLAGTALLYKYTALPLLALALAAWSFETWRVTRNIKTLARCVTALVLGGMLAAALELGFFLWHDGGAALWDCTVTFNRSYLASDNFSWTGSLMKFKVFLGCWWILFLLAGAALLKPSWRLGFWLGALFCGCLATGGSYYGQYYILLMPFWALLAVAGILALAEILARRLTFTSGQIKCGLTALALALILFPDAPWLTLPPETFSAAKFAQHSVFLESLVVGRRAAELSSPGDRVWVAASEPQILCYANRTSATRFITVYSLVIPSPELERYQTQAIQEVQAHQPKLIVWTRSWLQEEPQPSKYLFYLNDTLARNYHRVGGYVLAGKDSRWMEPLADSDVPAASVILFKRNEN